MIRIILSVALVMLSIRPAFAKEDLRGISLDMSRGSVESQLSRQCDQLLRSHDMVVCLRDLTPSGEWNDRLTVIFDQRDAAASIELAQVLEMTERDFIAAVQNAFGVTGEGSWCEYLHSAMSNHCWTVDGHVLYAGHGPGPFIVGIVDPTRVKKHRAIPYTPAF